MRLIRLVAVGLTCLVCLGALTPARAEAPPDPLRLVPAESADFLIEVKQPRVLAETITNHALFKEVQKIAPVQEILDSTSYRRFYQLIAYFEKQLGAHWPELLDPLAGGGAVLAVKIADDPAPALVVIQGKDKKQVRKFADLGLEILEQELARQESKDKVEKVPYRGLETVHAGKGFHAAVVGATLVLSNAQETLQNALDLHFDGPKKSMAQVKGLAEARKLLPPDPLALAWLNLETVRKQPKAKDVFGKGRDPILTVLFGGLLDTARRAPFLCAGVYRDQVGFSATLRMPRGREGKGPEYAVHVPTDEQSGAWPLLEPRGVLLSHSFYLDAGKFWDDRAKLFTAAQIKSLEDLDKNSGVFLAGKKLSKLLTQAGAHHRFVAVNQPRAAYKKQPKQMLPAFALISEMRDPQEFSKSMDTVLRAVALLAGSQYKVKLQEAKHGDYEIVGYRFSEDAKVPQDAQDLRFNFSPCFVTVGKQFVACSTLELCHQLIDILEKEAKNGPLKASPAAAKTRLYSEGGAEALKTVEDQLLAQAILSQAVSPDEAREQFKQLTSLARKLGRVKIELKYGVDDFRADVRWKLAK
jgi:hypothetical protein